MNEYVKNTLKVNKEHFETLLGQRPTGSLWRDKFIPNGTDDLSALIDNAEEFKGEGPEFLPFCKYFKGKTEDTVGSEFFILKEQLRGAPVYVGYGAHGLELNVESEIEEFPTTTYWVIIGPASKEDSTPIIYTCYPGRITEPIPETFYSDNALEEWDEVPPEIIKDTWAIKTLS